MVFNDSVGQGRAVHVSGVYLVATIVKHASLARRFSMCWYDTTANECHVPEMTPSKMNDAGMKMKHERGHHSACALLHDHK